MVPVDSARYCLPAPNTKPPVPAYADRRSGQVPYAQRPKSLRAVAEHRSGPVYLRHGKSMSSMTMNRPADTVDHCVAAPATADHRQAEYFRRLLAESRQQIDQRIDKYQKATIIAEARGDVGQARGLRRMVRIEEQERRTVEELIDHLQRRFPLVTRARFPRSLGGGGLRCGRTATNRSWQTEEASVRIEGSRGRLCGEVESTPMMRARPSTCATRPRP